MALLLLRSLPLQRVHDVTKRTLLLVLLLLFGRRRLGLLLLLLLLTHGTLLLLLLLLLESRCSRLLSFCSCHCCQPSLAWVSRRPRNTICSRLLLLLLLLLSPAAAAAVAAAAVAVCWWAHGSITRQQPQV